MKKIRNYTIEDAIAGKLPMPFNSKKAIEVIFFKMNAVYPIRVLFVNGDIESFSIEGKKWANQVDSERLQIEEEINLDGYVNRVFTEFYNVYGESQFNYRMLIKWLIENKKLNIPE